MIKLAMRLFLLFSLLNLMVPQKVIMDYSDYGWAVFLDKVGEHRAAKDILLKHKEKDQFYYNKLGEFERVNYDKSLYYFKKGERIDPAEPVIIKNMGKTYFFLFFKTKKNSDIENAKKYFKRYLKTDKTDFFVNYLYGESLKFTGEITKGVEYLINAYQVNPSSRILKEIISIKLSLKDYFWIILKYKQFKLFDYLSEKELDKILEFIERLKIKTTDKDYDKIKQFVNAVKPNGNLNILKKLIIINFKNKNYSKVVNIYRKNKKLFEETKPPSIVRFYLFSLYYSENYYELSKEINKRFRENPDSAFLKYLLSRYYYRLGYKKLPFIFIRNIEKPSFISDEFYNDYKTLVKIRYWLAEKDRNKLKNILTRVMKSGKIKKSSLLLKINILKAALFINEERVIKNLLKENNRYFKIIYLCNNSKSDDILRYIESNKREATVVLNELINNGRIGILNDILKKIDKQTLKPEQYDFFTGRYYELSGKYKKAYKYYEKTIDKNSSLSYLNYYTYFSLQHNFKIKHKEEIIDKFIKEGKTAAVYDTLGLLLLKANQKRKGEKYLLKAYIFTPEDKLIKMHLADYYYSIENYKKALYFYKKSFEGECFTDEYNQNRERIKKRVKELKKMDFNLDNYYGLYSVKIYSQGKVNPLRLKIKYDGNHLLLSFYHFPMTKMADIYTNGDTYFINYREKRFYEGRFSGILENIIGIDINKDDILNLFGIKAGINFIPYKEIEINSYKKGFPEKIEIKGENIRIRIKLLKFNIKRKIIIKQPNTDNFNEVFDAMEVIGE